ncbi:MAG: tetratricopeptide repeat protein [Bacteroidota bacterium]
MKKYIITGFLLLLWVNIFSRNTEIESYSYSLNYYNFSLAVSEEMQDSLWIVNNWIEIGQVYHKLGHVEKALSILTDALKVSERNKHIPEFFQTKG